MNFFKTASDYTWKNKPLGLAQHKKRQENQRLEDEKAKKYTSRVDELSKQGYDVEEYKKDPLYRLPTSTGDRVIEAARKTATDVAGSTVWLGNKLGILEDKHLEDYRNTVKDYENKEKNFEDKHGSNIAGVITESTPYVVGGYAAGVAKGATVGARVLNSVGRNVLADGAVASSLNLGSEDNVKEIAKEVATGVPFSAAGQAISEIPYKKILEKYGVLKKSDEVSKNPKSEINKKEHENIKTPPGPQTIEKDDLIADALMKKRYEKPKETAKEIKKGYASEGVENHTGDAIDEKFLKETTKKNLVASNAGELIAGGFAGGSEAEFNKRDYDNDGEHTSKDNMLGALVGVFGMKTVKKMFPKSFENSDHGVGMFVGAKPNANGVYEDGAFSDISTKKTMSEIDDSGVKIKSYRRNPNEVYNHVNKEAWKGNEFYKNVLKEIDPIKDKSQEEILKTWKDYGTKIVNALDKEDFEAAKKLIEEREPYDSMENMMRNKDNGRLKNFIEHDELFKKYPHLKNYKLKLDRELDANGMHSASKKEITLKKLSRFSENDKSTLLHEIQHAIQDKEDWPRGGNINEFKAENTKEIDSAIETLKDARMIKDGTVTIEDLAGLKAENIETLVTKISKVKEWSLSDIDNELKRLNQYQNPYQSYEKLWGEQQSRATQYRQQMSPEERQGEDWTKTLKNVEGEYNEPIIKYHGERAMSVDPDTKEVNFEVFNKFAEPLPKSNNILKFVSEFKQPIETYLGNLKIDINYMLNKSVERDKGLRQNILGYIKPTLERPAYIIENEGKFHFIKPYIDEEDKVRKFLSVISDRDGNVNMVTSTMIRDKDVRRIAKNGRLIKDFTIEDGTHTKSMPVDKGSISKNRDKNNKIEIQSSPHVSSAIVGGIVGGTNDLDQDGEKTYRDLLIGAIGGGVATKTATKVMDNVYAQKAIGKLKQIVNTDTVDAFTGHKIYKKKEYMNEREKMISAKNAKLEDFAQLHEQLKNLTTDAKKDLHNYMSGDKTVTLTPKLKEFANFYMKDIEESGKKLVDMGILDQAQFDRFQGKYLHRVYKKDLARVKDNLFNKGKTLGGIYQRGREWEGDTAEFEAYLKGGMLGSFHHGKIEAKKLNGGKYKFSQDETLDQRERWGEITDIAYTLPESLKRMHEMLEHGKMLSNVLTTKYVEDEAIQGYTQLIGKRYGALNNKYVPKDIADDINEFNRFLFGEEDGKIFNKEVMEAFNMLSTFWKKTHTVFNPTAHINNLLSNVTMQYMQGVNPVKAFLNAKKGAEAHFKVGEYRGLIGKSLLGLTSDEAERLKILEKDEDLLLYIKASNEGLFGRSKLNDILGKYINTSHTVKKNSGLKKVDDVASAFYQGEDNIMRFSLLRSLVDQGKSFEEAIKEVNNTIPDYTKPMSMMARYGRKSMLTPFISWTYYSTPIILRQLKDRPERAAVLLGSLYAINQVMGIDPYDSKDIPQQNFSMKRIPIYKNGKNVTTLKVDRWIPHNEILSPHDFVKNLFNGGAWKGGYEVLNNQNLYYGGKITHNTGIRKAYDISKYAAQQISPDIVDKAWNLAESKLMNKNKRRKNPVIQPRTTSQELINILGFNTMTYDKKAQKIKTQNDKLK